MLKKRLLERLRDLERDAGPRRARPTNETIDSILRHVGKILNTRQGSAPIAPDFGIPDFTDLAISFSQDSIPDIEEALRQVISKYEPRLADVKIGFDPQSDLRSAIAFKLEGRVEFGEKVMPVIFETLLTADGRLAVREEAL
ncbi:MAG: type VI secretion system baseplate subunit TssE [Candidatus Adiutrix sp.]|jgi:type VI secretion system protein|nr:type VI secretion system baseplate subunit TssE [Candidatus Adiutrix sp.]